ncbi:MAG: FAD-dependent oxidoreductase, partial [Nanoarchaeota archaeon]|nr:FAD-dependent oxidoreductase [Nanoarchaeota archaeon]
ETLIIGAGPAGLAAAIELSKAKKDFLVIERQSVVGGLAKTREFREKDLVFRTDTGPHRFFSQNQKLYDMIGGLLGEHWIQVKRQTRQFIEGKFYDYPVNAMQALRNIGPWRACIILFDYLVAKIRYGLFRKPIRNFADYVYSRFGRSLGELNMINYTEKIWGMSSLDIHEDWASQRIKGLSITSLVKDMVMKVFKIGNKGKPKTLVDVFYYPESGTGLIYETMRVKLQSQGYKILLNTEPTKIIHNGGKIKTVICRSPEGELEISCKNLVESVPMKEFLTLLDPKIPSNIFALNQKLKYRSQAYIFITLNQESVTADQWIYFPEKSNPIGRMSEMRNFSHMMSPAGKTSLFLEFFCTENDDIWNMSARELFELAMLHLTKLGFTDKSKVRNFYQFKEKNVYPIYDIHYKEYLGGIKEYLDNFENLYYIGRPGRFRYNNQDHSLEMGILAAKSIIDDHHYDIEEVGNEKIYYERGTAPLQKSNKEQVDNAN